MLYLILDGAETSARAWLSIDTGPVNVGRINNAINGKIIIALEDSCACAGRLDSNAFAKSQS